MSSALRWPSNKGNHLPEQNRTTETDKNKNFYNLSTLSKKAWKNSHLCREMRINMKVEKRSVPLNKQKGTLKQLVFYSNTF